ncbi:MAG TPA: hypothetical protein VH593_27310 [Ktedonobacteraceae bacterium]
MGSQMTAEYRQSLVAAIEREIGQPLAASLCEAFLSVPRHIFITSYYEHGQLHTAPAPTNQSAWDAWLTAIYQDQALTTQIDARGLPTSSSSQPAVMALMLSYMDIKPGMRILEIGTGTGYNAALLAHLTGDPRLVTTLEIDPILIEQAQPRIETVVGTGMVMRVCDGTEGDRAHTLYDRIIATGSTFPIPQPWIRQLVSGGKLVMDLRGQLGGGLIVVMKQADGSATGHFLPEGRQIGFMRLRPSPETPAQPVTIQDDQHLPLQEDINLTPDDPGYACAFHFCTFEQLHEQNEELNLWLQWAFPGLGIKWKGTPGKLRAVLTDEATQTIVTLEPHESYIKVQARGNCPLWSEIARSYHDWLQAGKPERERYRIDIEPQGRQVIVCGEQEQAVLAE